MCKRKQIKVNQYLEKLSYCPEFKIAKGFSLLDLKVLIENDIFPRVRYDEQARENFGGDLENFPSTFDFVIALCLNPNLSLQYLSNASSDIICFTVMMLNDLLFSGHFCNLEIINLLNNYIANHEKLFTPLDYNYVIDIMGDFKDVNNEDTFNRCHLANYVNIDTCISKVFSED